MKNQPQFPIRFGCAQDALDCAIGPTRLHLRAAPQLSLKTAVVGLAFLIAGAGLAHSDTDRYDDVTGKGRSDRLLDADADYCKGKVGENKNGVKTSPAYKRCMRIRGWRFLETERDKAGKVWWDPDQNMWCRHGTFLGVPAEDCSSSGNF
jgi:hypothetical protein